VLEFHKFFVYMSKFLMDCGLPRYFFDEYTKLGVRPQDIYRTTDEHRIAVMTLAIALTKVMSENMDVLSENIGKQLNKIRPQRREATLH